MPKVEKFVVDCKASRFTVKAFASGMTSGLGHNPTIGIRDFEGETQFVPDTLENASLMMKIRAPSLTEIRQSDFGITPAKRGRGPFDHSR